MKLAETLLLRFSRPVLQTTEGDADGYQHLGDALSYLEEALPGFPTWVRKKRVVDFGCGAGRQAIQLAAEYNATVLGLDTNTASLETARRLAASLPELSERLRFESEIADSDKYAYDVVLSKDSFEHFDDPARILQIMRTLLAPGGRIAIVFGPPWWAPYGSHMNFFTQIPWVHILFSEHTVLSVRSRFRTDGATRYEEVESGLNRMTIGKFERIIRESGLKVEYLRYDAVKRFNPLTRIPLLRELFINQVSCLVAEPG